MEDEPRYDPRAGTWDKMCPCILAEQIDPDCEWHGRINRLENERVMQAMSEVGVIGKENVSLKVVTKLAKALKARETRVEPYLIVTWTERTTAYVGGYEIENVPTKYTLLSDGTIKVD